MDIEPWGRFAIAVTVALIIAVAVTAIVAVTIRQLARRRRWAAALIRRSRAAFRCLLVIVLVWAAFATYAPAHDARPAINHLFLILAIGGTAWLVCTLALFLEDLWLERYRVDVPDNRVARQVRTQVLVIRRLTVVAAVVIALGAALFTFPGAQAAGASLLASAGVVSIVAGLAAQSTLANVFAGMQLAFSGAIRVDDVVIVEGKWGRIEEITLTYIVVHIWDDRRMVLPSTYFTTTPFENWTRRNSELLGSVEFDLDWRVTPAQMRQELHRILGGTELWDQRVGVLQVTEATGGFVRVRVLVSAVDAGTLFDLRCLVREQLITWLHTSSPESIPRSRVQLIEAEPARRSRLSCAEKDSVGRGGTGKGGAEKSVLFTGEESSRGQQFTGPIGTLPPIERVPPAER